MRSFWKGFVLVSMLVILTLTISGCSNGRCLRNMQFITSLPTDKLESKENILAFQFKESIEGYNVGDLCFVYIDPKNADKDILNQIETLKEGEVYRLAFTRDGNKILLCSVLLKIE